MFRKCFDDPRHGRCLHMFAIGQFTKGPRTAADMRQHGVLAGGEFRRLAAVLDERDVVVTGVPP